MIIQDLYDNGINDVNYHGDGDFLSLWNYLPRKICCCDGGDGVNLYLSLSKDFKGNTTVSYINVNYSYHVIQATTTLEQALADMIILLKREGHLK